MIRYFDYRPELDRFRGEILDAMLRVLDSGHLVLGPEVHAFEQECASRIGVSGAVGVASGTDALALALRALDVGPGHEVLTVANAGVPTVAAIRSVGAVPRFVDVEPGSLLMDPAGLEAALTPRSRCVIPVHLYGQPLDLEPILELASRTGLRVVEDCAQAFGASRRGRAAGSLSDVGCFSFYPTKPLGAYGDGGLCTTDDPEIEARLRALRFYGFQADRHAHIEGLNSRLDEIQAAILRVKLRHVDDLRAERGEIAGRYREALRDTVFRLPQSVRETIDTHHLFVIRAPDRGRSIRALEDAGIGYGIHYAEPVHLMEAYAFLGYRAGELPVTEQACAEVLSLPCYAGLAEDAVDSVVRTLRASADELAT